MGGATAGPEGGGSVGGVMGDGVMGGARVGGEGAGGREERLGNRGKEENRRAAVMTFRAERAYGVASIEDPSGGKGTIGGRCGFLPCGCVHYDRTHLDSSLPQGEWILNPPKEQPRWP